MDEDSKKEKAISDRRAAIREKKNRSNNIRGMAHGDLKFNIVDEKAQQAREAIRQFRASSINVSSRAKHRNMPVPLMPNTS